MSTKVLVFESDAAFASELRNELGKLGCNTHVVDDGNVGLQQAAIAWGLVGYHVAYSRGFAYGIAERSCTLPVATVRHT